MKDRELVNVFIDAVKSSPLDAKLKMYCRVAIRIPWLQEAILQFIRDKAPAAEPIDWLKLILENLDEIAAFIELLFKIFS